MRAPLWARVYVSVFGACFCGATVVAAVATGRQGSGAVAVPLLMLALGGMMAYRLFHLSVLAEGDLLVVRNTWSTRTVRREDVEGFRIGSAATGGLPFSKAISVLLRDGSLLPLDVTAESWPGPRRRARLQERLETLRRWSTRA